MSDLQDLELIIKSGTSIIFIEGDDEKQVEAPIERLANQLGRQLLGVQGGGKSLAAKSVAGSWRLPLLRLDFATLYNIFHGKIERNLRESLKTAESMAPCVLWIDEIEKGLATAKDIEMLPPDRANPDQPSSTMIIK